MWGFAGVLHARSAADISLAGDMERKTLARASSAPAGVRLRGCARPGALPCIVRSSHSIKSPGCKAHQVFTNSRSKDSFPCGVRLQLQCPTEILHADVSCSYANHWITCRAIKLTVAARVGSAASSLA